jgi:hypothetical protein
MVEGALTVRGRGRRARAKGQRVGDLHEDFGGRTIPGVPWVFEREAVKQLRNFC